MENNKIVTVRLSEQVKKEDAEKLRAYVINSEGKIIESVPFRGSEAQLKSSRENLEGKSNVYIAAALPENLEDSKRNERTLIKAGAYNVVKNFNENFIDVFRIPSEIFRPFPFHFCLIKGNVNKNFTIDGAIKNIPLCDLKVHVCEIETELIWPYIPIYYRRIPDWVIREIGDKIKQLTAVEKPVIRKPIGPDPAPDTVHFAQQAKFNSPLRDLQTNKLFSANKQAAQISTMPAHVKEAFDTTSVEGIRQALINYHEIIYPYICLWPIYWPWIYACVEDTVVTTDCNGNFELWKNIFFEETPLNIYIWIEAFINGSWQTIYKPPIPCYTRWSYACNTNINITLTQYNTLRGAYGESLYELISPCDCGIDGPDDAVWFRSIGESASALHIEQNENSTITVQGASLKNGGCTDILLETQRTRPFGSGLTLKLFCGANIFAAGVTHYRWKKTMITDANQNSVSGSPAIISGNVSRPYLVKLSASHYETHYCALGAEFASPADFAYRIPHHDVLLEPVSSLQDAADTGRIPEWTSIFFDSAYIDSNALTDGIWKFELELLKLSGGSFVVVPVNTQTFQVSEYSNIDNSQDAPANYLNIAAGKATSYKMNVRIDNAHCDNLPDGDIFNAELYNNNFTPTGVLSGPCGFIHYTDAANQLIRLSFRASQPRNFATFSFDVTKGDGTYDTGIHASGYVLSSLPNPSPNNFAMSGGVFSNYFSVAGLLYPCPGQAAFSENLHVAALATNGTRRLDEYDAWDVNAFALSNV